MDNVILPEMALLVSIVDRGKAQQINRFLHSRGIIISLSYWGLGTASSEIMDVLGITEREKNVTLSLLPRKWVPAVITQLADELQMRLPGKGILFTIPLSAITRGVPHRYTETENRYSEVQVMYEMDEKKYEMIFATVDEGSTEVVMSAARAAGARGGTIMRVRAAGEENTENFFGLELHEEKEVLTIIVERSLKVKVMQAVAKVIEEKEMPKGMIFSVPVSDVVGIG